MTGKGMTGRSRRMRIFDADFGGGCDWEEDDAAAREQEYLSDSEDEWAADR